MASWTARSTILETEIHIQPTSSLQLAGGVDKMARKHKKRARRSLRHWAVTFCNNACLHCHPLHSNSEEVEARELGLTLHHDNYCSVPHQEKNTTRLCSKRRPSPPNKVMIDPQLGNRNSDLLDSCRQETATMRVPSLLLLTTWWVVER